MGNKAYCGIGSRKAPKDILLKMTKYASVLERLGFILRSGGAIGSDKAFEKGILNSKNKEIFLAKDAQNWAYNYVRNCMPVDRPSYEEGYLKWDSYVQDLLARNMMQVLGFEGDNPSKFILCWTPAGDYKTSLVGGTGYALRCALLNNIPIFNLNSIEQENEFKKYLKNFLI
jgi:hypothetical protein